MWKHLSYRFQALGADVRELQNYFLVERDFFIPVIRDQLEQREA